jgi:hypothetical protein
MSDFLLDRPRLLEWAYQAAFHLLRPLRRWLQPETPGERILVRLEEASKGAIFDCRMCGQCVLHSTGMTCPMTCPKHLRNGPCGGVREDGTCEILPEMPCVWVQAWERSQRMARYGQEILDLQPPLDHRLEGSSAWVNDFTGRPRKVPSGWET